MYAQSSARAHCGWSSATRRISTIPGATVTLTSATGVTRNATANERGEALFDGLAAGDYVAASNSPASRQSMSKIFACARARRPAATS